MSLSSVLVKRIRPFPRLKIAPAFRVKMALYSLNSRKTERERERSARFCFFFARRKLSAQERKKYPIGLDRIGKIFWSLIPSLARRERVSLVWKTPPSFEHAYAKDARAKKKKKKKKNKALTI